MEGIERDVPVTLDDGKLDNLQMKQNLSENLNEKGMLRKLLEKYFDMIDNLGKLDILKKNVGDYEDAFENLLAFSKTSFMEEAIWRAFDNGEAEEYCGAHLRNLLSPFNNMIAVIKSFSKGEIKEETLKSLIEGCRANLDENKEKLLEFCKFLKK